MPQKVFIATPCYDGKVVSGFVASLLKSAEELRRHKIDLQWDRLDGCCYLPVSRNKLVADFLRTDCTDLVWIDSDMIWDPAGLRKLLRYDVDIVGGIHPLKQEGEMAFPVRIKTDAEGRPEVDPYTGLIEADGLPTSFLRIRRNVFETISMREKHRRMVHEHGPKGDLVNAYLNFFDCEYDPATKLWWGEDYNFCRLAAKHGFSMWVEPNITFGHVGTKTWVGNYHEYLRQLPGGGGEKPASWHV